MAAFWQKVKAAYRIVCQVEAVVAAICLILTVVIIFGLAVFRTLGAPLHWALESALLVFSWGAFLGADVAYRENKLVYVDFILVRLPPRIQNGVQILLHLIIAGFLALLVRYGVFLTISTRFRAFQGMPWLSYSWVASSLPVCSFLMLITTAIKIHQTIAHMAQGRTEETGRGRIL